MLLAAAGGAASLVFFERIRTGEARLRTRFAERAASLEAIRNGIYLSGTLARDYLSAPADAGAPEILARLRAAEEDTEHAIARSSASPELRGEVVAYWKVLNLMVEMARRHKPSGLDEYFRRQFAQRREVMLRIAGEIGAALEQERAAGEGRLAEMYRRLHRSLGVGLSLMLTIGIVVAVGTERRMVRLESETRALSAKLFRAQEQERRAIARELHDDVGQTLSRLSLDAGNARHLDSTVEIRPRLESIAVQAESAIDAVRRIALSLRPSMLDDLGLVAALDWLAREAGRRGGLSVRVDADEGAGELPDAQRTCIYRVAQEAIENCARHSAAKHVYVVLKLSPRGAALRVEDDGKGFEAARTRGVGILGMEERVTLLGGRFQVVSEPGRGTKVTAELPA